MSSLVNKVEGQANINQRKISDKCSLKSAVRAMQGGCRYELSIEIKRMTRPDVPKMPQKTHWDALFGALSG